MSEAVSIASEEEAEASLSIRLGRWWQLSLGVICMSMIANLQYGWTLFVNPIHDKQGWSVASIQVAFSVFVVIETWLVPIEGYLVDRFGPQLVGVAAGVMVALAWVVNSMATSLPMLYLGAVIGGIGAGAVYGSCVGNALKWFPDRRGFAAGVTAMGYGAGAALTVAPIANMIRAQGYEATFFKFGIAQGAVVFLVSWFLRAPDAQFIAKRGPVKKSLVNSNGRETTPIEMLKSAPFWIMYVMFVLTGIGGLILTAQVTPIAKDFGISNTPVSLLGMTSAALTMALSVTRVLNGVSRAFFGWISDLIGRENTMFIAFAIEAVSLLLFAKFGHSPLAFVLIAGLAFFAYGEIYSLFPAACGDLYGRKYAAANAGLLYTAKGAASLLVPLSSFIVGTGGNWQPVFLVAAAMNLVAAIMALVALKPARLRVKES